MIVRLLVMMHDTLALVSPIEPQLPAEPNGAGSVGCKRALYGDAGWAAPDGEPPNPGLDTPTTPTHQLYGEHHVPGQTSVVQRVSG